MLKERIKRLKEQIEQLNLKEGVMVDTNSKPLDLAKGLVDYIEKEGLTYRWIDLDKIDDSSAEVVKKQFGGVKVYYQERNFTLFILTRAKAVFILDYLSGHTAILDSDSIRVIKDL